MRQWLLSLVLFVSTVTTAAPPAPSYYSVGIVPQLSPSATATLWEPLLTYLSAELGVSLRFQTARDLAAFEQRVSAGDFDFVYLNPFHYTVVHDTVGYDAFACEAAQELRGIIVVAAGNTMRDLSDLQGQRLAVPGDSAFAATLIPLKVLGHRQITVQPVVVASHESVLLSVARGAQPAGGTIQKMFDRAPLEMRQALRVLWRSEAYTPHPFAAHPGVPADLRKRMLQVLEAMPNRAAGRAVLKKINFAGFRAVADRDYDPIRRLDTTPASTVP